MGARIEAEMEGKKPPSKNGDFAGHGHPTFQASPLGMGVPVGACASRPEVIIMTSRDLLLNDASLQMAMTRSKRRGLWCCVGLWLAGILTTLFVAFGLMALLVYLIVHPQLPRYSVQNVQLHHLPNQTLTAEDPDPQTNLSVLIESHNPNWSAGIIFEDSAVIVKSDGMMMSSAATIPKFYQGHKNTTVLEADFSLTKWACNLLVDKGKDLTNWPISVNLDVKARLRVGWLKAKQFNVRVRCTLNVDVISFPQKVSQEQCKVFV